MGGISQIKRDRQERTENMGCKPEVQSSSTACLLGWDLLPVVFWIIQLNWPQPKWWLLGLQAEHQRAEMTGQCPPGDPTAGKQGSSEPGEAWGDSKSAYSNLHAVLGSLQVSACQSSGLSSTAWSGHWPPCSLLIFPPLWNQPPALPHRAPLCF